MNWNEFVVRCALEALRRSDIDCLAFREIQAVWLWRLGIFTMRGWDASFFNDIWEDQ